jgi:hypothetical protein
MDAAPPCARRRFVAWGEEDEVSPRGGSRSWRPPTLSPPPFPMFSFAGLFGDAGTSVLAELMSLFWRLAAHRLECQVQSNICKNKFTKVNSTFKLIICIFVTVYTSFNLYAMLPQNYNGVSWFIPFNHFHDDSLNFVDNQYHI